MFTQNGGMFQRDCHLAVLYWPEHNAENSLSTKIGMGSVSANVSSIAQTVHCNPSSRQPAGDGMSLQQEMNLEWPLARCVVAFLLGTVWVETEHGLFAVKSYGSGDEGELDLGGV